MGAKNDDGSFRYLVDISIELWNEDIAADHSKRVPLDHPHRDLTLYRKPKG